MAFTGTAVKKLPLGNEFLVYGTYANTGGSTGGAIATGLNTVTSFMLCPNAAAVIATQSVINGTLPLYNNPVSPVSVTIVTSANEVGYWQAIGN